MSALLPGAVVPLHFYCLGVGYVRTESRLNHENGHQSEESCSVLRSSESD